ncbi:MAG: flagellar type III secretion system protein FlhB [Paracoccaceae bacterium]
MSEDDSEKEHEATAKKLEDARRKGDVPRPADLAVAAAYGGFLLVFATSGGWMVDRIGGRLLPFLDRPDLLAGDPLLAAPVWGGLLSGVMLTLAPLFAVPAVAALAVFVAARAFVISPQKLAPKRSRISIVANAGQKFGRNGLFEFAKSLVKLAVVTLVLGLFLTSRGGRILATLGLDGGAGVVVLADLLTEFLFLVVIVAASIGVVDFLWQRGEHLRRNRMSRKELMDEMKQAEGDPAMKQQRRQRGYDIATNRMLADVPQANVVVVNPTHYAVALKWNPSDRHAPICVAKGVDEIAARIRETAAAAGVPIRQDAPTARALHATVDIGQEIPSELFKPVAAAIRFAERMRARASKRGFDG